MVVSLVAAFTASSSTSVASGSRAKYHTQCCKGGLISCIVILLIPLFGIFLLLSAPVSASTIVTPHSIFLEKIFDKLQL
jgi:hypothetical protein